MGVVYFSPEQRKNGAKLFTPHFLFNKTHESSLLTLVSMLTQLLTNVFYCRKILCFSIWNGCPHAHQQSYESSSIVFRILLYAYFQYSTFFTIASPYFFNRLFQHVDGFLKEAYRSFHLLHGLHHHLDNNLFLRLFSRFLLSTLYSFSRTLNLALIALSSLTLFIGPTVLRCNNVYISLHFNVEDSRLEYVLCNCRKTVAPCDKFRKRSSPYKWKTDDRVSHTVTYLSSVSIRAPLSRITRPLPTCWPYLTPHRTGTTFSLSLRSWIPLYSKRSSILIKERYLDVHRVQYTNFRRTNTSLSGQFQRSTNGYQSKTFIN